MFEVPEEILIYAFRYALGRLSSSPYDVAILLIKNKDKISKHYKTMIVNEIELYLMLNWEELKKNNYIWEDINGKRFKENQIDNRYLKNIIRYCRRNFRPQEQIAALNNLVLRRGIKCHI